MEDQKIQSRDEVFLKKITEAVLRNLENEQFGVSELSDEVAISRFQLHRKLKLLKGKSVSQFIREIRLAEAMKMLQADAATTSEIGYKVGFTSPSYFNKCFRDYYGFAPGEVKKRNPGQGLADHPDVVGKVEYSDSATKPVPATSQPRSRTLRNILLILGPVVIIALVAAYFILSTKRDQVSIAILPLDNLTGYSEQGYFVSGMHDALIGELGQISALRVISRTSTLRYQESKMLIQDIARQLGVDMIVEGSVYGSGDSVRIQLQLIEAFPKERHVWAKEYHHDIQHALAIHSSVVRDIAKEIRVSLTPDEESRINKTRSVNPETYKAYLRGMSHINQHTAEGIEKGISHLLDAVRIDPGDPLPWAGLAIGYNTLGHGPSPPADAFTKAKAAASRALAIDEALPETHLALAMIALYNDWDWKEADKGFRRALEINPNLAEAHAHYAWYKLLFGGVEECLTHGRKATELDPFSSMNAAYLACEYWWVGRHDDAMAESEKALKLAPDYGLALYAKGGIYSFRKLYDQAIEIHKKAAAVSTRWRWTLALSYVAAGNRDEAIRIADEIKAHPAPIETWGLAELYAALGNKDEAFYWLNECYRARFSWMPWIACNPGYESLRRDPRFDELLKKLDLPALGHSLANR